MKKYINLKNKKLHGVKCNMCAAKIEAQKDILTSGAFVVKYQWNYFSNKDGEIHIFVLCENCYDKLINNFKIPVDIEKTTELM